jgi:hypothetical protein
VTTYNHAPYVEQALESLRRQSSRDFETIITDDASTDGTGEIVAAWLARTGFQANFVRNPKNVGICRNRNAALAVTRGRFVASLSGDDLYEPEFVGRQAAMLAAEPAGTAAVYCDAVIIGADGGEIAPSYLGSFLGTESPPEGRLFARLMRQNFLCAPATVVRRSAIEAVGGYDESLSYEDRDMWLRLSHRFEFRNNPLRLLRYRRLPSSFSRSQEGLATMRRSFMPILEKWCDVDLDPDARRALAHSLRRTGRHHLYHGEFSAARRALSLAARADPHIANRLLERLVQLPGAGPAARTSLRASFHGQRLGRSLLRALRAARESLSGVERGPRGSARSIRR